LINPQSRNINALNSYANFNISHYFPLEFIETVLCSITDEVTGISLAAYGITSKPPITIEWE
jgi:GMP synthase PP-ATPase subunit